MGVDQNTWADIKNLLPHFLVFEKNFCLLAWLARIVLFHSAYTVGRNRFGKLKHTLFLLFSFSPRAHDQHTGNLKTIGPIPVRVNVVVLHLEESMELMVVWIG